METVHYYNVDLNWESDRKGLMSSPVLNSNIEVATPPEFPKGMEGIWSPEHLQKIQNLISKNLKAMLQGSWKKLIINL